MITTTFTTVPKGAINDHTGMVQPLIGLCKLNNGKVGALLDENEKYWCINELYMLDGVPHIAKRSVGGTVTPWQNNLKTIDGIREYNSKLAINGMKIARVALLDGTVITVKEAV